jgi:predicted dehydrogenase
MSRPRLGFLGVGWIGRNRMAALAASGIADVVAVADAAPEAATAAAESVGAQVVPTEALLGGEPGLDGVVIATPNAQHADQTMQALCSGLAVFCQKPLGRSADETQAVVDAARRADRLLGVDLSYRHLTAVGAIRELLAGGELGRVYAADLVFHNAYGPDKPWFTDPTLSGGGCVIDLGIHLVDLLLWLLDDPQVADVTSRLFAKGQPLTSRDLVEDYAVARLDLTSGATATLACSWFLHAGVEAEISATLHGEHGSVALHNVDGSFYDFRATHRTGTSTRTLVEPPDDWGGRAAVGWAAQLAADPSFDERATELVDVAAVLDRIYGR